ncbi:hypothetical protein [Albibacillus kandeliae]|jgi:hypothetical protein|uniref:hypothetical protein n=1 Tax=Albibacillus kandeliae TaxID=2174228 RepID=UPI000D69A9DC|nr:hypothetical protein [Albibacillus kandeliae]
MKLEDTKISRPPRSPISANCARKMMHAATEAELLRLSEREGQPVLGDLTERQARRRIAQLKELGTL